MSHRLGLESGIGNTADDSLHRLQADESCTTRIEDVRLSRLADSLTLLDSGRYEAGRELAAATCEDGGVHATGVTSFCPAVSAVKQLESQPQFVDTVE